MVKRDLTKEQLKADILNKLINVGAFGRYHIPIDQLKSWFQGKIRKNGKQVTKTINELVRRGFVIKSDRHTIYANPLQLNDINDFIEQYLMK